MSLLGYALRAVNRAKTLGLADTVEYSYHVVRKAFMTSWIDLRYGATFSRTEPGWKPNAAGRYMNTPTDVYCLESITNAAKIGKDDVLVDVGCGDGFPIAYWLNRGIANRIVGIEIDPAAAAKAKSRFKRLPNVRIVQGDATIESEKSGGTLFFLFNPFAEGPTKAFEQSIRGKSAKILYMNFDHIDQFAENDWNIDIVKSTKPDYRQYRYAIITPK